MRLIRSCWLCCAPSLGGDEARLLVQLFFFGYGVSETETVLVEGVIFRKRATSTLDQVVTRMENPLLLSPLLPVPHSLPHTIHNTQHTSAICVSRAVSTNPNPGQRGIESSLQRRARAREVESCPQTLFSDNTGCAFVLPAPPFASAVDCTEAEQRTTAWRCAATELYG